MYCSVLLYFFARYLAEALLGILTKDSSLLYLVMLHGVSHTQKSLSCSTKKSGGKGDKAQSDLWISLWTGRFAVRVCGWTGETHAVKCNKWWGLPHSGVKKTNPQHKPCPHTPLDIFIYCDVTRTIFNVI